MTVAAVILSLLLGIACVVLALHRLRVVVRIPPRSGEIVVLVGRRKNNAD